MSNSTSRMPNVQLEKAKTAELNKMFSQREKADTPESQMRQNLLRDDAEATEAPKPKSKAKSKKKAKKEVPDDQVPVNFWGSPYNKQRVAMACTLSGMTRYELIEELMNLYEKKHGPLPVSRPDK